VNCFQCHKCAAGKEGFVDNKCSKPNVHIAGDDPKDEELLVGNPNAVLLSCYEDAIERCYCFPMKLGPEKERQGPTASGWKIFFVENDEDCTIHDVSCHNLKWAIRPEYKLSQTGPSNFKTSEASCLDPDFIPALSLLELEKVDANYQMGKERKWVLGAAVLHPSFAGLKVVKSLVERYGADPTIKMLHHSPQKAKEGILESLIELAQTRLKKFQGDPKRVRATAAAEKVLEYLEALSLFMAACDVDSENSSGLLETVIARHIESGRIGVNYQRSDQGGRKRTILHAVCAIGDPFLMTQLIVELGADPFIKDAEGNTPRDVALKNGGMLPFVEAFDVAVKEVKQKKVERDLQEDTESPSPLLDEADDVVMIGDEQDY
jgi:hypothetical protein